MTNLLTHPAELFLGSDAATAMAQGARRFGTAAQAVRFAMEHAAPVSLHGALLRTGGRTLGPRQIRALHRQIGQGALAARKDARQLRA